MAEIHLKIDEIPAWRFEHWMPVLWPWLFDGRSITEARRLHSTVFDAAVRFDERRRLTAGSPSLGPYLALFERIRPDAFAQALGTRPDAVISLDLFPLESSRPYNHVRSTAGWERFFSACRSGEDASAVLAWEDASLTRLHLDGRRMHDARLLAGLAEGFGLERTDRAQPLVWLLFGLPVSRPAHALTHEWLEAAASLPSVAPIPRVPFWQRLLQAFRGSSPPD